MSALRAVSLQVVTRHAVIGTRFEISLPDRATRLRAGSASDGSPYFSARTLEARIMARRLRAILAPLSGRIRVFWRPKMHRFFFFGAIRSLAGLAAKSRWCFPAYQRADARAARNSLDERTGGHYDSPIDIVARAGAVRRQVRSVTDAGVRRWEKRVQGPADGAYWFLRLCCSDHAPEPDNRSG